MKKILPIVYDKNKDLSKKFTMINTAHMYCDITDDDTYDLIKNGSYRYINKFFITTSLEVTEKLKKDFLSYPIYFIGTIKIDKIESIQDVSDIIQKYYNSGIIPYSYKEIRDIKDNITEKISVDLDICLVGKTSFQTMLTSLSTMVDSIRNTKMIDKYILGNITTYYCGEKKEMLLKILRIDKHIDLEIPKSSKSNLEIFEQIKNTKLYDLIDRNKYNYVWRAYKCINDHIENKISIKKSRKTSPKIVICIDISRICTNIKYISIQNELKDIMTSAITIFSRENTDELSTYGSIDDDREKIYVIKDIVAIGTEKIMKYYMSFFDQYGMYDFKQNRSNPNGVIIPADIYPNLTYKARLMSETQLFEHLQSFGDIVLTTINNISDNSGFLIKKKNLIIVTYFGIYEQFKSVKQSLENLGYTVHNFSYIAMYNEGGDKRVVDELKSMLTQINPEYILWWVFNISANSLLEIRNANPLTKHLYYNWDEPYNWKLVDAESKARYLSTAFITCEETTKKYIGAGALHAYCLYPGYTPSIHKPLWLDLNSESNNEYDCDVSFICTNLYEDPNIYPDQIVIRKKLIETIYIGQKIYNYSFAIYGPDKFKDVFPLSYRKSLTYDETNIVFNRSKINICTHVVGNKQGYLNERVFLIMASGGLLLIDPVPGVDNVLVNGVNCVMINQNRICSQIKSILENYPHYEKVKHKAYESVQNYTWDDWGYRLEEKLLIDYS